MYYPSSENKGADQLCGYCKADLRLCFRICRLLVFPRGGSFYGTSCEPHFEKKGLLPETAQLIRAFVFATQIVQFLFFLNPKFQASSLFLKLYRPVCVGPGQKPQRPFFSRRGSCIIELAALLYKMGYQIMRKQVTYIRAGA